MIHGHCHCGAVSVSLPDEAAGVVACHCDDCQKLHGNFFAMLVTTQDLLHVGGSEHVRWYRTSPKAERAHCETCGSRLFKRPDGSDRIMVSVGLFDASLERGLVRHVWEQSKPHWYPLPPTVTP